MVQATSNNFLDRFLKQRVLLHVLFWIVVVVYFTLGYGKPGRYGIELIRSLAFLPNHIWLVYVFLYFLIPDFLFKNKILSFLGLALICIAANMYFSFLVNFKVLASEAIKKGTWWSIGSSLLGSLTIVGIAVSIKLLRHWYQQKQETLLANQEKVSTELQMLKSQVHPHFLFNTLNNLYQLTLEQSKLAPVIVLKLSELLRYMLYECNTNLVPLEKEISIMDNYIDLEKMRYGSRLEVSKNYSGVFKGKQIPPLLFLPLLENCFKHGTSNQIDQSWISIYINVENDILKLILINSKLKEENSLLSSGGIGLKNVEKRLKLLYGDKYNLKILLAEESYTVTLSIELGKALLNPESAESIPKTEVYAHQMPVGG